MLRGWDTYYGSLRCFDWLSLSAVDLAAVRAAGPAMADLAGRLRAGLAADPVKYGGAMRGRSLRAWPPGTRGSSTSACSPGGSSTGTSSTTTPACWPPRRPSATP